MQQRDRVGEIGLVFRGTGDGERNGAEGGRDCLFVVVMMLLLCESEDGNQQCYEDGVSCAEHKSKFDFLTGESRTWRKAARNASDGGPAFIAPRRTRARQ